MRTKGSFITMLVNLLASIIPSFLGIILNSLIISKYGSDTNGVVSTIFQTVNLFTILEGGFSLASMVALYKPYLDNDTNQISRVLTATRIIYCRIGYLITTLAIIFSFIFPYIIVSQLSKLVITGLFLIATAQVSLQFLLTLKYNILFSVGQKEYVVSGISLIFGLLAQVLCIIAVLNGGNIVWVKFVALSFPLLRMPIIIKTFHKYFPNVSFKHDIPDFSVLHTTKDVMAQKFAGLIFGSTDLIIISIMINTVSASVYAVYNMIFGFIKSLIFSIILAPFNAFGQLYATNDKSKLASFYKTYQLISIISINILVTTTCVLILPFVELYTRNIIDANYTDVLFSVLFAIFVSSEFLSNMFGLLANSSGHFKEMKKISLIAALVNLVLSLVLVRPFGIKGVVLGTIIAYTISNIYSVYVVHIVIIGGGLRDFLKIFIENVLLGSSIIYFSYSLELKFNNYFQFLVAGFCTIILNLIFVLLLNYILNKETFKNINSLLKQGLKINKNS